MMDSIIDSKKSQKAMLKIDAFIKMKGKCVHQMRTAGWKMCLQWKDASTSWEYPKDLKKSNPVQVAEYAIAKRH
jgi:hypothetical protein